jgi:hypothetical protein
MNTTSPARVFKEVSARKPDPVWLDRGRKLARTHSRQHWELGDWLVEGTKKWERRAYDAAERLFPDYDRKTLVNLAYVARALPTSRRRDSLSWSHHEAVAGMNETEQQQLLDHAASKNLSCAGFRRHLRALEDKELEREYAKWEAREDEKERKRLASETEEQKQARLNREQENQRRLEESQRAAESFRQQRIKKEGLNRCRQGLAPQIIQAGRRELAKKLHPDVGGNNDAMTDLNVTVEWLLEVVQKELSTDFYFKS